MYSALQSACPCRYCAIEMMQTSQLNKEKLRYPRRPELDLSPQERPSGIRAAPISKNLAHWHGSIVGPKDSPYEGGTFFLYIFLPSEYVYHLKCKFG